MRSDDTFRRTISQEMPPPPITKIRLKITYIKFHLNVPGDDELNKQMPSQMIYICDCLNLGFCSWQKSFFAIISLFFPFLFIQDISNMTKYCVYPLAPFTNSTDIDYLRFEHGWVITSLILSGMYLLLMLNFNGNLIEGNPTHYFLVMTYGDIGMGQYLFR